MTDLKQELSNEPPVYPVYAYQYVQRSTSTGNVWPVYQTTPYVYNPFAYNNKQEYTYFVGIEYCVPMDEPTNKHMVRAHCYCFVFRMCTRAGLL
jgi:hypothetical protein